MYHYGTEIECFEINNLGCRGKAISGVRKIAFLDRQQCSANIGKLPGLLHQRDRSHRNGSHDHSDHSDKQAGRPPLLDLGIAMSWPMPVQGTAVPLAELKRTRGYANDFDNHQPEQCLQTS